MKTSILVFFIVSVVVRFEMASAGGCKFEGSFHVDLLSFFFKFVPASYESVSSPPSAPSAVDHTCKGGNGVDSTNCNDEAQTVDGDACPTGVKYFFYIDRTNTKYCCCGSAP